MEISLPTGQLRRTIGFIVLVILLIALAFLARGCIGGLLPHRSDVPSTSMVKAVVRDYLDGRLAPDDPRISARMATDMERLSQLPHGAFIAFEEDPRVVARAPQDAPTWARLVGSARYEAPAGGVFLGEITVEAVKEGDAWKIDRILVRPLMSTEP